MPAGLLLVDKPAGITSFDVVRAVRRRIGERRVGHAGSLDPIATGLLLLGYGWATKRLGTMLKLEKSYEGIVRFGVRTDTADSAGKPVAQGPVDHLTMDSIRDAMRKFLGQISQVPPMYSALKHEGRPLYALARRGMEVPRAARQVTILEFEPVDWNPPDLRVRVSCTSGTYVRSLAEDLAVALGTVAHVASLRRTRIGPYRIEDALAPDSWRTMPVEDILARGTAWLGKPR